MNAQRWLALLVLGLVASSACKRKPKPPANLTFSLASIDETGKTISLNVGLSDKDWTDTVVAGTFAVDVVDEGGKSTCTTSIPFPATSTRSELSGAFELSGTFATPCLFERNATRTAKLVFTSEGGVRLEASRGVFIYRPGDVAAQIASAQASASAQAWAEAHPPPPEPWPKDTILAMLAALPTASGTDVKCDDTLMVKRPRHERVGTPSIDEDDLLLAVGRPESAHGCHVRTMMKPEGDLPALVVVESAKSCIHPKLGAAGTFEAGGYNGVAVVFDTAAKKVLCSARVIATSSDVAKGSGSDVDVLESDFRSQRSRARVAALQRISLFLESSPSGIDMQETWQGRIY